MLFYRNTEPEVNMKIFKSSLVAAVWLVMAGVGPALVWAQAGELRINLLHPDDYAYRSMKVIKKTGGTLKGMIKAYDPVRSVFLIEDVSGRVTTLPASELGNIEFIQMVHEQAMQAQEPPWKITAVLGEEKTLKIPARELKITSGYLTLQKYAEVQPTPSRAAPPPFPPFPGGPAPMQEVLEVFAIAFQPAEQCFYVRTGKVKYSRQSYGGGGGGPSGFTKGLR
jgi:hypothetical protein